jgi:CheY-like chemotaxis protein
MGNNPESRMVLVVDDSMLIRHAVTRFLEEHEFRVESATNGLEALELVAKSRPDLIITDLNMPKMTGAELIQALQARPETAGIPIVVVAGRKSQVEEVPAPQADFIIYKDIDLESQLERALASLLNRTS